MNARTSLTERQDWPSAPECLALLSDPAALPLRVLELAWAELRVRGAVERTPEGWVPGPTAAADFRPALSVLRDAFLREHARRGPVAPERWLGELWRGRFARRWADGYLLPALAELGWLARAERRVLWIRLRPDWVRTLVGDRRSLELQALLMDGQREFTGWAARDARRADAFLADAGAAALLITPLYPFYEAFRKATPDAHPAPAGLCRWAGLHREFARVTGEESEPGSSSNVPVSRPLPASGPRMRMI